MRDSTAKLEKYFNMLINIELTLLRKIKLSNARFSQNWYIHYEHSSGIEYITLQQSFEKFILYKIFGRMQSK